MKKKSLESNAIFNIIYKILNAIFPLVSVMYISRILMPSGVGIISYAQNIASYFIVFATLGMPIYGTREIARVRDDKNITNQIFNELFIVNAISTILCMVCYIGLVILNPMFNKQIDLYLACGLSIFFNLINVDWFYQGQEEYIYIAIRNLAVKFISIVALFIFVKDSDDYVIYALISSLAIGGNYIFNIVNIKKYISFDFSEIKLRRHLKPVFLLGVCIITMELYNKIDITMLGFWCDDSDIGYYSNAQKMTTLVITFTTAISAVFLPRLSYCFINDKTSYHKLISKGLKIVLFFTIPCFVGMTQVSSNLIPLLFGNGFEPAIMTTNILSISILVRSICDLLCYQVIISSGQDKKFIVPYSLAIIINITLNFIFIPIMNQNGAALASIISELIVNCLLLSTVLKLVRPRVELKYVITIIFSTICMAFGVEIIDGTFNSYFLNLCGQIIIGGLVYFAVNFFLKNEILKLSLKRREKVFD